MFVREFGIEDLKTRMCYDTMNRYDKRFVTEFILDRTGKAKPKSDASSRAQAVSFLQGQLEVMKHSAKRAAYALRFERESNVSDKTVLNNQTAAQLLALYSQLYAVQQSIDQLQRHYRNHATGKQNLRRAGDEQQEG